MRLIDDDIPAIPDLTIDSVTVNEGVGTAILTVSISVSADEQVRVNTNGQSALGRTDYIGFTKTLQFVEGGPTTQTVEVTIVDDSVGEWTEYFYVRALFPREPTYPYWQGRITIEDDD